MVRKVIEEVYDDLDGTEGAETITFALNGTEYEIDLSKTHETELSDALAKFTAVARKTAVPRGRKTAQAAGKGSRVVGKQTAGPSTAAVREWAQAQGLNVSDRGRISGEIMSQYAAAH